MKKKFFFACSGMLLLLVLLLLILLVAKPFFSNASDLSEAEAKKIAVERYSGTVKSIKQQDGEYVIELAKPTGMYLLLLNIRSGEVSSLTKISDMIDSKTKEDSQTKELSREEIKAIAWKQVKGEIVSFERQRVDHTIAYVLVISKTDEDTSLTIDAFSGEILKEETRSSANQPTMLTKQEAASIALKQTDGAGTIDEIWIDTINGVAYYIVNIEIGNDQEYVIEINSITGEIRSITQDEDGRDSDDD
nr:PepSY domain-containing protein [uncultured Bacillus sp.]